MTIRDLLDKKGRQAVLTIPGSATLDKLVKNLHTKNVGALIIENPKGKLAGIVSERDIIHQLADKVDFSKVTVAEIMAENVLTVAPSNDLKVAMELMCTARVRHLPVVSESKIEGIITIGDAIKAMRDADESKFTGFLERFADSEEKHAG